MWDLGKEEAFRATYHKSQRQQILRAIPFCTKHEKCAINDRNNLENKLLLNDRKPIVSLVYVFFFIIDILFCLNKNLSKRCHGHNMHYEYALMTNNPSNILKYFVSELLSQYLEQLFKFY